MFPDSCTLCSAPKLLQRISEVSPQSNFVVLVTRQPPNSAKLGQRLTNVFPCCERLAMCNTTTLHDPCLTSEIPQGGRRRKSQNTTRNLIPQLASGQTCRRYSTITGMLLHRPSLESVPLPNNGIDPMLANLSPNLSAIWPHLTKSGRSTWTNFSQIWANLGQTPSQFWPSTFWPAWIKGRGQCENLA